MTNWVCGLLPLTILLGVVSLCATPTLGQERLHSGRITRSFTEPIEQSVAAGAEVGIVSESQVKEGDRVRVGDPLATILSLIHI